MAFVLFLNELFNRSQELQDVDGEARACHFLGYAHYWYVHAVAITV